MTLYGYARVSSLDQDLTVQEQMLRAAGCQIVRAEEKSGTARGGRSELRLLLDFLHKGDTLVVTRIDRLARSMKDLQDIVHELKAKGVALKATEQVRAKNAQLGRRWQGSASVTGRWASSPPSDIRSPVSCFRPWPTRVATSCDQKGAGGPI